MRARLTRVVIHYIKFVRDRRACITDARMQQRRPQHPLLRPAYLGHADDDSDSESDDNDYSPEHGAAPNDPLERWIRTFCCLPATSANSVLAARRLEMAAAAAAARVRVIRRVEKATERRCVPERTCYPGERAVRHTFLETTEVVHTVHFRDAERRVGVQPLQHRRHQIVQISVDSVQNTGACVVALDIEHTPRRYQHQDIGRELHTFVALPDVPFQAHPQDDFAIERADIMPLEGFTSEAHLREHDVVQVGADAFAVPTVSILGSFIHRTAESAAPLCTPSILAEASVQQFTQREIDGWLALLHSHGKCSVNCTPPLEVTITLPAPIGVHQGEAPVVNLSARIRIRYTSLRDAPAF